MKYLNFWRSCVSLVLMICFIMTLSCSTNKAVKRSLNQIRVSPFTQLFIANLTRQKDLDKIPCSFKPDSLTIKQFKLQLNSKNEYVADGVITLRNGASVSSLNVPELEIRPFLKNKYRCRIPVCKFYMLLTNKEIVYFEITEPINYN